MTLSHSDLGQLRPADPPRGSIVRVEPARRREAVGRLVGAGLHADHAAADRFLHYARANAISLEFLWARLGGAGAIEHVALAVPTPGRAAMVFACRPSGDDQVPAIAALIDHACRDLARSNVNLAQALIEPTEQRERAAFVGGGFIELAHLSYLERPLSHQFPVVEPRWPPGAMVERYRAAISGDLAEALERSYEKTLDCPGLYGLRRTADIIEGHKATGEFDPSLWTLLRLEGRPAGAILLNPFPAQRTVELVYLGLAARARGKGLGRQLLRHGLCLLRGRRERTLTLAVDQRNAPALALYASEGMRPVLQRVALIRPLRRDAEAPPAPPR
jgi:ribosomal protein S18 acetylase RimI-like enzyme